MAPSETPHGSQKQLRDGLWRGRMDFSGGYASQRIQRWLALCTVAFDKFQALSVSAQQIGSHEPT